MKKLIFIVLIIALIAGVIFLIFSGSSDKKSGGAETPVIVVKAYRQPLFDSIEALGNANANESITITASTSETISDINFTDGQLVKQGDVIAKLEQREEQAALEVAKARLQENQRELQRIEALLKNKAASKRDYDERLTLIQVTQQEIKGFEAQISDRTLRAPFDGILGIRRLSVGSLVQPGELITTLDDIHLIKLDFTLPALHIAALKPGVPIQASTDAYGAETFDGSIENVDSRVDPVTRSVLVRAVIPNPDSKIIPGMLMQVRILKNMREALVVAEESILQRQDKQSVLIVNPENKVEERTIQVGTRIPGLVEVTSGLEEGEQVVIRGVNRVQQGSAVTIQQTWDTVKPPPEQEPETVEQKEP